MKLAALCLASATFAAAQIQLLDGPDAYSGTIYALNPATNTWGNVCDDDGWNLAAAHVVCRQAFGTNYEALMATHDNYFGSADNNDNFVYDDVDCGGSENNLAACTSSLGHDCGHDEEAGVICVKKCVDNVDWKDSKGRPCEQMTEEKCSGTSSYNLEVRENCPATCGLCPTGPVAAADDLPYLPVRKT